MTSAGGPPAVLNGMLAAKNFTRQKVRTIRNSGSGAADVSPELMRLVQERLAPFAYRSYGMTECPMLTSGALAMRLRAGRPEVMLVGASS